MNKEDKISKRAFLDMEPGLKKAHQKFIQWNKENTHEIRILMEEITQKIIEAMKKKSYTFRRLYVRCFRGGSIYDLLKVGKPDELDIDILLKLPEDAKPDLEEDTVSGFVKLKLENFEKLARTDPDLYNDLKQFVDDRNYLLTSEMKSFMQSIFDQTLVNFPGNIVKIGKKEFEITKIQRLGPAFTLSIEGAIPFTLTVDLVPCILLTQENWPQKGFRSNPYPNLKEFFIVPKEPKTEHPHLNRYWRLSFQIQEKEIIFDRFWTKPAIRFLKRIRDHFGQDVASYAIKTMFIWELHRENPTLDRDIPDLWTRYPTSDSVVYMLGKYLEYLEAGKIPYFWNSKLNLLASSNEQQIRDCKAQIANMLQDIKANPTSETILKYMS